MDACSENLMGPLNDIATLNRDFPRKRCSAGAILRDPDGHLLIVKPSYREGWLLPGGVVEALESPVDALCREVREETGFTPTPLSVACIDYLAPAGGFDEAVHFLFHCQDIDAQSARTLSMDGNEIVDLRFADPAEAAELLLPSISRRLQRVMAGESGYFHDGLPALPFMPFAGSAGKHSARLIAGTESNDGANPGTHT